MLKIKKKLTTTSRQQPYTVTLSLETHTQQNEASSPPNLKRHSETLDCACAEPTLPWKLGMIENVFSSSLTFFNELIFFLNQKLFIYAFKLF